tara:strand:- start:264 stop:1142 length:879 start_codon:yes stop_codon:yes gene_type:complete
MASTIKVDRIETPGGTGNISFAQPISGDGSQLTGITAGTPADDSVTGAKIDLSLVAGDIMYASGVDTLERLPKGTDGEVMILDSGIPSWASNVQIDLSLVAGDIIYSDATDSVERLPKGTDGEVLTLASGVPSWAAASGGGKVVKVWNYQTGAHGSGTTLSPIGDTIPQQTEGNEVMTLAMTPIDAANKLYIHVALGTLWNGGNVQYYTLALFQDATADALACSNTTGSVASHNNNLSLTHFMDAPTAGVSTTFKVRVGGHQSGTTEWNGDYAGRKMGGVMATSITIMEIAV